MKVSEYQQLAHTTAKYETKKHILNPDEVYVLMGLAGEAGELANLCKKAQRGDFGDDPKNNLEFMRRLIKELGGISWYLAENCTVFDLELDSVLAQNLELLADRSARGVIKGSGDYR